jgi:anti-sigma factor RsiW
MRDERETTRDEKLQGLLRKWEAPVVPDGMDERVMAAYRREAGTAEPFWTRWLASSIRVPVPVALVVALLLIFTAALALRPASPPPTAVTPDTSGPVRAAQRLAPVETGASLAGFQAVTEITATVVQEGTP